MDNSKISNRLVFRSEYCLPSHPFVTTLYHFVV